VSVLAKLLERWARPLRGRVDRISSACGEMDRAVIEIDTVGFFTACRDAVRRWVAADTGLAADTITADDVRGNGAGPGGLAALLEAADGVLYSGRTLTQEELIEWRDRTRRELKQTEVNR